MSYDPSRVKSLFLAASDLTTPAERAAYLDRECGDPELRARVEALLAAQDRDGPAPMGDPGPVPGEFATLPVAAAETLGRSIAPEGPGHGMTLAATGDGGPDETVATRDGGPGGTAATRDGGTAITIAGSGAGPTPAGFAPGGVVAGRYTLLGVLGQGGMGTVYLADQARPVRRQVALKLIRSGMDSRSVLARFDAERQALAMMDHPNIARVYDAGATESGHPFFVMELVRGEPITAYCDRHRFPVDARLRLFVEVCRAVQHAHQKGIIHRDLKPTNVLVAEVDGRPTPKVIDFGVAKATEASLTDLSLGDTGAIVGTPAYMSPEQADPSSMDIDTRTDVYALGVILYELLAGTPPIDPSQFRRGALLEMLRMLREVDPAKPSTRVSTADGLPSISANRAVEPGRLKRELRGDLDWIAMKALEKDRTRRYESASGLAADILRHLAGEPVLAAPPSRSYRAKKFVAKHRVGVAAAGLVLLALVAGVAGTTWGLVRARHSAEAERLARLDAQANERKAVQAAEAEKQAKGTVEDVLGFVENRVFAAARPEGLDGGLGYDVKLADAIAAALPAIEGGFPGKPLTEARLRRTIGRSFHCLGELGLATAQFDATLALLRLHQGPDHPDTLAVMSDLSLSQVESGRQVEALKLGEQALALARAKLGPDHPQTLYSMASLASCYDKSGRQAKAFKIREELVPLTKTKLGPDHPDTLVSMGNLALSYAESGQHAEAIKLGEQALALARAKLGPDHPQTLNSIGNLASCYVNSDRLAEAIKLLEELVPLTKTKFGPDHPQTLNSMFSLAVSCAKSGRQAEAIKLLEEVLALRKAKFGPDHPQTLNSMGNLAICYTATGRHAQAFKLLEELVPLTKTKLGPDHLDTLNIMGSLAVSCAKSGRQAEAIKLFEEVVATRKAKFDPDHPDTLRSMGNLAICCTATGRHAQAIKLYEEVVATRKAKLGPDHPDTIDSMVSLAICYTNSGQRAEAIKLREETLALRRAKLGPDHPDTINSMNDLAICYTATGPHAQAIKLYEEMVAIRRAKLGPDHPDTLTTMSKLADNYAALGQRDDATKLREELLPLARARFGPDYPDTLTIRNKLVEGYLAGGREREALALLAERSSASPGDTILSMQLAALQAWYGRGVEFAETRRRVFANANGTQDAGTAERAAKVGSLLPSADGEDLDAAIAMGRRAVELGKDNSFLDYFLMSLGMAEYRKGQFPEALATLDQARANRKDHPEDGGRLNHAVDGTTAFFRAMCLFRLGKADEARALATEAAGKVKPPPADGKYPFVDGANHDDLIVWLAYREAKALIGFDPPPPPRQSPETNDGNRAGRRHPRAPGAPPPDILPATSPGLLDTAQDVCYLGAGAAPAPGAGRLTRTSRASGLPAPRVIRSRAAPGPLPTETARRYSPGDRSSAVNLPFVSSTGRDSDSPESRSIITVAPATGLPSSYKIGWTPTSRAASPNPARKG